MLEPLQLIPCSTLSDDTRAARQIVRNRTPQYKRKPEGVVYCGHIITPEGHLWHIGRGAFVQFRPVDEFDPETLMVAGVYTADGSREVGSPVHWKWRYKEVKSGS